MPTINRLFIAAVSIILVSAAVVLSGCGHSSSGQLETPEFFTPPQPEVIVPADSDGDTISDANDNCPTVANLDQADYDGDDVGNVCDDDVDGDGVANVLDNCPDLENADQTDSDGDGAGDACDAVFDDRDGDTIGDGADNCPDTPNLDQADQDGDKIGDVCDDDVDGDGHANAADNCWLIANDQTDTDGDGFGNVCDDDDDNDGIPDVGDNCRLKANADQSDVDVDGIGDVCDSDADADGFFGDNDNCPLVPNPDQADNDGDGTGDACDTDDDNDGFLDGADNCQFIANDQVDMDIDGIGDACDDDIDGDGFENHVTGTPVNTDAAGNPWGYCTATKLADCYDNCAYDRNGLAESNPQADNDNDAGNTAITNRGGDVCDLDDDNDGRLDDGDASGSNIDNICRGFGSALGGNQLGCDDNCQFVANPQQIDIDSDAMGNECDPDMDNDTILNGVDNCKYIQNATQTNNDADAFGDICDLDDDNDGILDDLDICPMSDDC